MIQGNSCGLKPPRRNMAMTKSSHPKTVPEKEEHAQNQSGWSGWPQASRNFWFPTNMIFPTPPPTPPSKKNHAHPPKKTTISSETQVESKGPVGRTRCPPKLQTAIDIRIEFGSPGTPPLGRNRKGKPRLPAPRRRQWKLSSEERPSGQGSYASQTNTTPICTGCSKLRTHNKELKPGEALRRVLHPIIDLGVDFLGYHKLWRSRQIGETNSGLSRTSFSLGGVLFCAFWKNPWKE